MLCSSVVVHVARQPVRDTQCKRHEQNDPSHTGTAAKYRYEASDEDKSDNDWPWLDWHRKQWKGKKKKKVIFPPPSFCGLCHITVVALPDWAACACLATRPAAPMREAYEVHVQ